jgi:hypothetical protein
MYKLLPCSIVFLSFLFSCGNRDNSEALRAINKSLSKANEVLAANNEAVYWTLNRKLNDSRTAPKASLWEPSALAVKKLSADINKYIDSLKHCLAVLKEDDIKSVRDLYEKEEAKLYSKLVKYAADVVKVVDPTIFAAYPDFQEGVRKHKESLQKDIADRFNIKPDRMPVGSLVPASWSRNYFEQSTPLKMLTMLNKIQCDVLLAASALID